MGPSEGDHGERHETCEPKRRGRVLQPGTHAEAAARVVGDTGIEPVTSTVSR